MHTILSIIIIISLIGQTGGTAFVSLQVPPSTFPKQGLFNPQDPTQPPEQGHALPAQTACRRLYLPVIARNIGGQGQQTAAAPAIQRGTVCPLQLAAIGDQTVSLGRALQLTLAVDNPFNDPLTLSIEPFLLFDNATFDARTGHFYFRPHEAQVGQTYNVTFAARTPFEAVSETIQISVVKVTGPTTLVGRLLDANDAAQGGLTPLVGAAIRSLDTGQSTTTDSEGHFSLANLPPGENEIEYDGSTINSTPAYAAYRSKVSLIADVTNEIDRPVYLMQIDPDGQAQIDPDEEIILTNPNLNLELTIPPNTIMNEDGTPFEGTLPVSAVPTDFTPGSLPAELDPAMVVTVQPMGLTFNQPAPVRFPNSEGFPAGTQLDLWSLDHSTGQFFKSGTGVVSADEQWIETIPGDGIRESSWHFFIALILDALFPGDRTADNQLGYCPTPPRPKPNQSKPDGPHLSFTSSLTPHDGTIQTSLSTPAYLSQGIPRNLEFVYTSKRAYPQEIVPVEPTISRISAVPRRVSLDYSVGGVTLGDEIYLSTDGLVEWRDETLRASLHVDTSMLPTGVYPTSLRLTSHYPNSGVSNSAADSLIVVNEQDSPFGAGWGMAGLGHLHENDDGTVFITDGSGGYQLFELAPIDLHTWMQQGIPEAGNWVVAEDGNSVLQTINGRPTFFVSPDTYQDVVLKGKFKVEPSGFNDDDFIGFVIGYQSPLVAQGDAVDDYEFILFDWKQANQTSAAGNFGAEGFSLVRVSGVISQSEDLRFWGHVDSPEFQVLATDFGNDKGWADNTEYEFELIYQSDRIEISINNETIFDLPGSFPEGRFGFYNYSQERVRYSEFTSSQVTDRFKGPKGDYSILIKNNDGSYTRRLKDGTEIHFDTQGFQTRVVDRNGNTTRYAYDGQGRLSKITDPVGLETIFTYVGAHLDHVTDPTGRVTRFSYSGQNLVNVTFPDGSSQTFGYDSRHLMTSETNRRGQTTTRNYDQWGRVTEGTLPDGSLRRTAASQSVGLIDLLSGVGTVDNPAPVVRPDEAQSTIIDGEGRVSLITSGPVNRFASVTDPAGLTTTYTRDEDGNRTQTRYPSGDIFDQTYDRQGNALTFVDRTVGGTSAFSYDSTFNQLTSATDPFNQTTHFSYDDQGNLTGITTPFNRTMTFAYNGQGLMTTLTDTLGTVSQFSYDGRGNLSQIQQGTGADQRTSALSYTSAGYLESFTDPLNRTATFAYDALGRLMAETSPDNRTVHYEYDADGNLTSLTPPSRPAHTFIYNEVGLITTYNAPPVTDGGSNQTRYQYNRAQQLTQLTRADGLTLTYTYDHAGRFSRLTIPRGEINARYDGQGRVWQLTAPDNESLTYGYRSGLVNSVRWTGSIAGTVSYAYDRAARLSQIWLNNARVDYGYDVDGLLTQAGDLTLAYNAQTGLLESTALNTVSDVWGFNAFSELTHYTAQAGGNDHYSVQYTRDKLGRITQKVETIEGQTDSFLYTYDLAGRLTTVQQNGSPIADYGYDANGNRTRDGSITPVYDDQDRLLQYGDTTYRYNAHGDLQRKTRNGQTTTYQYDVLGNLLAVTLPDGTQIDYLIDAQNRRIGKKVNDQLERGFLYQDDLNPIAELDSNGTVVSHFVYGSRLNVPDYMRKDGNTYRFLTDHLGSVRLVLDAATGDIIQRLDYDAFGRVLADSNPGFQPFGFAGGLYDPDTGLVRFGARDYDAAVGRWTTKDPIGFAGGDTNLYGYVGGDVVNLVDPVGNRSFRSNMLIKWSQWYLQQVLGFHFPEEYVKAGFVGLSCATGAYAFGVKTKPLIKFGKVGVIAIGAAMISGCIGGIVSSDALGEIFDEIIQGGKEIIIECGNAIDTVKQKYYDLLEALRQRP